MCVSQRFSTSQRCIEVRFLIFGEKDTLKNFLNLFEQMSTKINMILDIWEQGYGVTTLHVYHSVIPVEAYTREACMIEAMSKCDESENNHLYFNFRKMLFFCCHDECLFLVRFR